MNFENYLVFAIVAIFGAAVGMLIGDEIRPKQLAAKGAAGLMIGIVIVPALMPYYKLPVEVWMGIIGVSSVIGVDVIIILTQKAKTFLNQKKL